MLLDIIATGGIEFTGIPLQGSAGLFEGTLSEELFLLGRLILGFVFAFTGLNHFLDAESMIGYAEMKGVPAAHLAVPLSGGMLIFGGLGVALGILPMVAAGALAVFLLVTTPLMHDFWNVSEEEVQNEMTHFLKNAALFAATVALLAIAPADWPYAVDLGIF